MESLALCFRTRWLGKTTQMSCLTTAVFHMDIKDHVHLFLLPLFFSKFINMMMKHGDKVLAREIMTDVRR